MKIINRPSRFDEDFLLDLKRGDDIAWSRLTDELTPRLYNYLRYNLPSEEDVEDVFDSRTSLMPANLARQLKNRQEFDDLLRYVLEIRKR